VRNAATLAASGSFGTLSAPACLVKRHSQLARMAGKSASSAQPSAKGGSAKGGVMGRAQQTTLPASVAAGELQINTSLEQPSTMIEKEQMEVSVGQVDGAAEGRVC
jgi:hypothetical protein